MRKRDWIFLSILPCGLSLWIIGALLVLAPLLPIDESAYATTIILFWFFLAGGIIVFLLATGFIATVLYKANYYEAGLVTAAASFPIGTLALFGFMSEQVQAGIDLNEPIYYFVLLMMSLVAAMVIGMLSSWVGNKYLEISKNKS